MYAFWLFCSYKKQRENINKLGRESRSCYFLFFVCLYCKDSWKIWCTILVATNMSPDFQFLKQNMVWDQSRKKSLSMVLDKKKTARMALHSPADQTFAWIVSLFWQNSWWNARPDCKYVPNHIYTYIIQGRHIFPTWIAHIFCADQTLVLTNNWINYPSITNNVCSVDMLRVKNVALVQPDESGLICLKYKYLSNLELISKYPRSSELFKYKFKVSEKCRNPEDFQRCVWKLDFWLIDILIHHVLLYGLVYHIVII